MRSLSSLESYQISGGGTLMPGSGDPLYVDTTEIPEYCLDIVQAGLDAANMAEIKVSFGSDLLQKQVKRLESKGCMPYFYLLMDRIFEQATQYNQESI